MRLGRLEFGLVRRGDKSVSVWPFDLYFRGLCGCHLFEFFCFYVAWLGNECYGQELVKLGTKLKRLSNILRIRNTKAELDRLIDNGKD